ncbi:hypothetical protein HK096_005637, partial [Nowakowskiella sp. JEL0078]
MLPKLLAFLNKMKEIQVTNSDGSVETLSGSEWRCLVIDKICSSRWRSPLIIGLIGAFCETDIDTSQFELVSEKMIRQIANVETNILGSVVRQLMVFAQKGNKNGILKGLCDGAQKIFYNVKQDLEPGMTISNDAEGQFIVQILYGIRQDE